jgi:hypothetical protein
MRDSRTNGRLVGIDGRLPGRPRDGVRLAFGLLLVIAGAVLLVAARRGVSLAPMARWWPAILLGLGGIRLFGAPRGRWVGFWLVVAGIYGAIGEWGLAGLGWSSAWPVFVIGAGLAILGRRGPRPWLGSGAGRRG